MYGDMESIRVSAAEESTLPLTLMVTRRMFQWFDSLLTIRRHNSAELFWSTSTSRLPDTEAPERFSTHWARNLQ